MPSMDCALYINNGTENKITAYKIDNDYNNIENYRHNLHCLFCKVKVQFTRGEQNGPYFKNWPKISHLETCGFNAIAAQVNKYPSDHNVEILVSTILERSKNLYISSGNDYKQRRFKVFGGKNARRFVYALSNLLDERNGYRLQEKYEDLEMMVEDATIVKVKDIIGDQDEIIQRIENSENKATVCILKGTPSEYKPPIKNNCIILPLTRNLGGKYKNTQEFHLFINHDYYEKNKDSLDSMMNSFIICYGIAEKYKDKYQMEIFSIQNQVVPIKRY